MNLLERLFKIKYCDERKDPDLFELFNRLTRSLHVSNIFNPDFFCSEQVNILSFRAIPAGSDRLTSYVMVEDDTGISIKNISADLSEKLNVPRLIDPKITRLNDEFYVTFNSGYVPGGNDIFIMRFYPEMGNPRQLIYKNRQEQERNWAFFRNGETSTHFTESTP
jgi:hypothetical protein